VGGERAATAGVSLCIMAWAAPVAPLTNPAGLIRDGRLACGSGGVPHTKTNVLEEQELKNGIKCDTPPNMRWSRRAQSVLPCRRGARLSADVRPNTKDIPNRVRALFSSLACLRWPSLQRQALMCHRIDL